MNEHIDTENLFLTVADVAKRYAVSTDTIWRWSLDDVQADRRRLEIARALAADPKVIMLDEPSSGMDDRDTDALMADVRRVMAERPGLSFLIIEHDMRLVAALPDRVAVIDYGRKIADGDFSDVRLMPRVQEAYLGQKAARHA